MRAITAGCFGLLVGSILSLETAHADSPPNFGRDLFHREWQPADPISPATGDGLGPFFNARSCVACHFQGGSGGGGPAEHNVELLTLTTIEAQGLQATPDRFAPFDQRAFRNQPKHPALATRASTVLHRFHVGSQIASKSSPAETYGRMRAGWLAMEPTSILGRFTSPSPTNVRRRRTVEPPPRLVALVRSQRNTPSLFGARLIDGIPVAELEKLAKYQNNGYPEISGRVAPGGGKFGWRGQTPSLRSFVVGACANELGLQTADGPQPRDFVTMTTAKGVDMYEEQVHALVKYVASLELPELSPGVIAQDPKMLDRGRRHFSQTRCDACHVAVVGSVGGIYADLLLHDMGPGLSDPAALSSSSSGRGYYGTANLIAVSDESKQEWRTPPLWGVRLSPPYLHDGRAATIEAAIVLHGGEADTSVQLFHKLSEKARQELIAFVNTL